jgi:hypothetical protein
VPTDRRLVVAHRTECRLDERAGWDAEGPLDLHRVPEMLYAFEIAALEKDASEVERCARITGVTSEQRLIDGLRLRIVAEIDKRLGFAVLFGLLIHLLPRRRRGSVGRCGASSRARTRRSSLGVGTWWLGFGEAIAHLLPF